MSMAAIKIKSEIKAKIGDERFESLLKRMIFIEFSRRNDDDLSKKYGDVLKLVKRFILCQRASVLAGIVVIVLVWLMINLGQFIQE